MPDPLVRAHRAILADLSEVARAELVGAWDRLGSYDRADMERFIAANETLIRATALNAARAQSALLRAMDRAYDLDPAMPAKMLAKAEQPFTATWHALSMERGIDEAVTVGRSTTDAYGRDLAYQSARSGVTAPGMFVRDISPGSCDWCQGFAGVEFFTMDAASFGHGSCDCVAVPA